MTTINLLPWRESRRQIRQREFFILLAIGVVVTALLLVPVFFMLEKKISNQKLRNSYLDQQISALNIKIKEIENLKKLKQALLARMMVIQQLQNARNEVVRLFDELVTVLPEGIYLTSIDRDEETVTLIGVSNSNSAISNLMRNVEESDWITHPVLQEIVVSDGDTITERNFSLVVQHKKIMPVVEQ